MKKHQILTVRIISAVLIARTYSPSLFPPPQAEITSHEPRIMSVCSDGEGMISLGHYGATEISNKISQLKNRWQGLKDRTHTRQQLLDEALQAQQYYSSAQEVESWIKEKEPIVSSGDYGKDEDSAQVAS